jgi:hypothetical protein
MGWSADRWMAATAQVIAISSLALGIIEWREARRQVRLTSQPSLEVMYYHNEQGAGWKIINDGLGAAKLRGFRILVDGERVDEDFENLVARVGLPPSSDFHFLKPMVGTRYAAGSSSVLVWFDAGSAADIVNRKWKSIIIQSCYCSLYDECWLTSIDGKYRDEHGEDLRDDKCSPFKGDPRGRWWQG